MDRYGRKVYASYQFRKRKTTILIRKANRRKKMNINSDINVLGSLSDLKLILILLDTDTIDSPDNIIRTHPSIKTVKSFKRFRQAIINTLLSYKNKDVEELVRRTLMSRGISSESLLILFWNSSFNNELLEYLNQEVFFPALYSGRISLRKGDVVACLRDLRQREASLKGWADGTIETTASKYLTLLKKFGLMEGSIKKTITPPYLSKRTFLLYIYWLLAIESKSNILKSTWIKYSFMEMDTFIKRVTDKKLTRYIDHFYSGDNLKIEPVYSYGGLLDDLL